MFQEAPELERRVFELQSKIDRLTVSLQQWREEQGHLQPMEQRLSQLTDQCADIVDRWSETGERHAQAVGELEERLVGWNTTEARVQHDATARMRELQRIIEHEWSALRRIHEGPVRELREHASTLTEVSVAAATTAVGGFERTEARLAELETGLHRRLTELSDQVQTVVAQLRTPAASQPQALVNPSSGPTWPLEDVVRLHHQLRESGDTNDQPLEPPSPAKALRQLPEAATPLAERMETLEQAMTDSREEIRQAVARSSHAGRLWWAAVVLIAVGIATAGIIMSRIQQQVRAAADRVAKAEDGAQAATQAAHQQIAAAREDATHQIAEAREVALQAQVVGNVLAASDLVRLNLVGTDATALSSAQALWSRSRGFVFSGSRLPRPSPDRVYQIWILTDTQPVSAGVFVPDAAGRFTQATESLPQIPRRVRGVFVTVEPTGGRAAPSGTAVLSRAQ